MGDANNRKTTANQGPSSWPAATFSFSSSSACLAFTVRVFARALPSSACRRKHAKARESTRKHIAPRRRQMAASGRGVYLFQFCLTCRCALRRCVAALGPADGRGRAAPPSPPLPPQHRLRAAACGSSGAAVHEEHSLESKLISSAYIAPLFLAACAANIDLIPVKVSAQPCLHSGGALINF